MQKRKRRESSEVSDAAYSSSDEDRPGRKQDPAQQQPGLFWQLVEEYFAPLTEDTLKVLEDRISVRALPSPISRISYVFVMLLQDTLPADSVMLQVPPLGKLYLDQWADDDGGVGEYADAAAEARTAQKEYLQSLSASLAERVLGALVEAKIVAPPAQDQVPQPPTSAPELQALSTADGPSLEERIRAELKSVGLLDEDVRCLTFLIVMWCYNLIFVSHFVSVRVCVSVCV